MTMRRCDCGQSGCFRCKIQSIQVSPSALPTRRNNVAPRGTQNNNWEKGLHRHDNGTPVAGDDGKVIGLKQKSTTEVERMLRERAARGSTALRS